MARFKGDIKGHIGEKNTYASRLGNRYLHAVISGNGLKVFSSMYLDKDNEVMCHIFTRNEFTGEVKTFMHERI